MYIRYSIIITCLCVGFIAFGQDGDREKYIQKYKKIAQSEMDRTGIPASIKLAQGIIESNGGKSTLARKANNHFGIKCHTGWRGRKYFLEDDDYDANGELIKSCFRVYKNGEASYIAHSEFLRDPNKRYRYGFLFRLNPKDYKGWARGLKKAGYATSPTYASSLIRLIETYELYQYDDLSVTEEPSDLAKGIHRINDVKYALASGTESANDIAERTGTKVKTLLKYNEKLSDAHQQLAQNTRVFIQKKRKNFRGKKKYHYVQKGENMYSISQKYGIRLDKLLRRNRLSKGQEPAVDERIKLRGWKVRSSDKPLLSKEVYDDVPILTDPDEEILFEGEEEFGNDIEMEIDDVVEDEDDFDEPIIVVEPPETAPDLPETDIDPLPDPGVQGIYHVVQAEETLWGISKQYNTTVEAIKLLNGLRSNIISIGQRLRIK